jgi:L-ascorbate metabolism protein UlaG (beta-lactamase superfamily)
MNIHLIRNATLRLEVPGRTLLIDPYFAPKHSLPSFAGVSPNPTVALPVPIQTITKNIDACLVSHLHSDHFDKVAWTNLPKTLEVCRLAPNSKVVATHMEALDHATLNRAALRDYAQAAGITNLLIPEDGEACSF